MTERLQKILASRGVCSRRKAEELIAAGRVTCNGQVAKLGDSADPEIDKILLDGKPLPSDEGYVYILLNKPRGYVTTLSDEKGRPNAAQLVADCGKRVYPVGRLDMDSEGLLLFTNDGEFANSLMHPRHEVNKTYVVVVRGYTDAGLERLKQPVMLDGYMIRKPEVKLIHRSNTTDRAELQVTIHEGRNRQVRRMCDMAGMNVTRLTRICEGALQLGKLAPGKWRYLTPEEVDRLK
ncbi:MAG: rRNA pseudouridine synthase [Oscillospiraceae bacterium]|nr:rRNA pseudouridine synthase [Oscillospiraceae bacterium]